MKKSSVEKVAAQPKTSSAKDVAALAGVSRTQVSYVLNGTGSTHVSSEKRERILAAAKKLNYRPLHSAQSLRRGYSSEFSIFFPAPYNSRINEIIETIHEAGLADGCVVTQYSWNCHRDPERKREAFKAMLSRRPLGIFCSLLDLEREEIDEALASGVERILVLDVEPHDDLATFYLPVEAIGAVAATHLVERGHRRIAVIRPADLVQKRPFKLRNRGMKKVIAARPEISLTALDWPRGNIVPTLDAARAFTADLLGMPDRPTALYAYSDDYAFPVMRALREAGMQVPRDLAVLGTDDLPFDEQYTPSLSTIRFGTAALGERAVALINALITGVPAEDRFLAAPVPYLIHREST